MIIREFKYKIFIIFSYLNSNHKLNIYSNANIERSIKKFGNMRGEKDKQLFYGLYFYDDDLEMCLQNLP